MPPRHYDLLGKTENLKDTLKIIFRHLKPNHQLDLPIKAKRQTMGASQRLPEYFDQKLADRTYSLYRDDFDTFGYSRELPLKKESSQ